MQSAMLLWIERFASLDSEPKKLYRQPTQEASATLDDELDKYFGKA